MITSVLPPFYGSQCTIISAVKLAKVRAALPLEDAVLPVILGCNDEAGYSDHIARGAIEAVTLRNYAINSREG